MSNIIKQLSPQELQAWNVPLNSKIDYYDGKILVVSDPEPEAPFGIAAKAGISALFGIAVFTHAPLVGVVMGAYAVAKVLGTVRDLYGGENTLTTRLEQDLGIVAESVPAMAPYPVEEVAPAATIAASSPIGTATKLGAVNVPATVSKDSIVCGQCLHFQKAAFEGYDGQCLAYMDHAKSDDPIAAKCKAFKVPASPAAQLPTNKTELLDRLKVECSALLRLVKSQPIRAVGVQRTGKTTLVKKLALLRLLLLPGHKVIASTPHDEPDNRYPSVFQVVGVKAGKRDYPAIARQWEAMSTRIENGDRSSITTVWDEFGLFNKVMEEETLTSVLTSSLREATKHGEYPVFIVHGETQAFLPGSRGLVTVFLSSTVRVETIGQLVTGADGLDEMRPTGKFRVQWLDGTKEEGQIPAWLSEEFLISLLPNSVATNNQTETYQEKAPDRASQNKPASPVDQLNKMFQSEAFTPAHEDGNADDETAIEQSGTVIEISSDIGNYIKSRPDVTLWNVSSIKRANKKFRRHDDATLTKAFQILALSDRGNWDGESFRPA